MDLVGEQDRRQDEAAQGGSIEASGGAVHWLAVGGGVRLRVACWPAGEGLGGRGTAVLLSGRTEFIEKHLETVAALRARRFAVWSLDWRGQGASTRPLPDVAANHVEHFDEYVDDLDQVMERLVLPSAAGPVLLLGHSMGGLLAAHYLARRPGVARGAVLSAPMIDFCRGRWGPRWLVRTMVRAACLLPGQVRRYAPGVKRAPDWERAFEGNLLTSCADRHASGLALLRANPALALGGITWGWLRAAFEGVVALEDRRVLARIAVPVLVVTAGDERVVDNAAARSFALRLARGRLVEIAGARHELLRERDAVQAELWAAVDGFLAEVLG